MCGPAESLIASLRETGPDECALSNRPYAGTRVMSRPARACREMVYRATTHHDGRAGLIIGGEIRIAANVNEVRHRGSGLFPPG